MRLLASLFLFLASASAAAVTAVGSSTVYPFSTVASERFSRVSNHTIIIESTGTGGGFKLFCKGNGIDSPSFVNASRPIKSSEIEQCASNGIAAPVEFKIGYDAVVLARSVNGVPFSLTKKDIFLALAKEIPSMDAEPFIPNGTLVENHYETWWDIRENLPRIPIRFLGPPPTSGTRDSFIELVMEPAAKELGFDKKLGHHIREDGAYIEAGENDNLIIQKIRNDSNAIGIFGFSFLDNNRDIVVGMKIGGFAPTLDNIEAGTYTVVRPLFLYVKREHLEVPGVRDFVDFYISERIIGEDGAVIDKGLIPLPEEEFAVQINQKRDM